MALQIADVTTEYAKNIKLKKDDVDALINWANKQEHLPKINELQAILFLQSCYYSNEAAKRAMDTYFTMKTLCPELLRGKNPLVPPLKIALDNSIATTLPKKTPEGYTIIFLKLLSTNPDHFNFVEQLKLFDAACVPQLYQEGTSKGHIIVGDMEGAAFGHLTKVAMAGPVVVKKFLHYLQEGMPIRLKGLHFVNVVPFMDKVLAIIKPFMKMDLLDMLYLHNNVKELLSYVPLDCLPEDYGGALPSLAEIHEQSKTKCLSNIEFFKWEDEQITVESKRRDKNSYEDTISSEGTFKQLDID